MAFGRIATKKFILRHKKIMPTQANGRNETPLPKRIMLLFFYTLPHTPCTTVRTYDILCAHVFRIRSRRAHRFRRRAHTIAWPGLARAQEMQLTSCTDLHSKCPILCILKAYLHLMTANMRLHTDRIAQHRIDKLQCTPG